MSREMINRPNEILDAERAGVELARELANIASKGFAEEFESGLSPAASMGGASVAFPSSPATGPPRKSSTPRVNRSRLVL